MAQLPWVFLALLAGTASGSTDDQVVDCNDTAWPHSGESWSTIVLDASISFVAKHKVVGSTLHLILSASHSGYLGFGFAEPSTGHMKGADLLTVSVTNGQISADDRYADFAPTTYTGPTYTNGYSGLTAAFDVHNDWSIVGGSEVGGVTEVWLTRALVTGDQQDRDVLGGPNRIVWAWGASDQVLYHGSKRGATTATFFGSAASSGIPEHDGSWKVQMAGYTVPTQRTTCD